MTILCIYMVESMMINEIKENYQCSVSRQILNKDKDMVLKMKYLNNSWALHCQALKFPHPITKSHLFS